MKRKKKGSNPLSVYSKTRNSQAGFSLYLFFRFNKVKIIHL